MQAICNSSLAFVMVDNMYSFYFRNWILMAYSICSISSWTLLSNFKGELWTKETNTSAVNLIKNKYHLWIIINIITRQSMRILFILILFLTFFISINSGMMDVQTIFINANMSPMVHLVLIYDSASPNGPQIF